MTKYGFFGIIQSRKKKGITGTIHISNYVDTYYIIGEGFATIENINYIKGALTETFELALCNAGDGAVLSYSVAINNYFSEKTFFAIQTHSRLYGNLSNNPKAPANGQNILAYAFIKTVD